MDLKTLKAQSSEFLASIKGKNQTIETPLEKTDLDERSEKDIKNLPLKKPFSWLKLFFYSLSSLIFLAIGIWAIETIETLFARHLVLGYIGAGLFASTLIALFVMSGRELFALMRLKRVSALRKKGEQAVVENSDYLKEQVISQTHAIYARRKELSKPFDILTENDFENSDTDTRFSQFEKEIMAPLDKRAKHIISDTAKRVSMLTAVSPIAALDVAFVCWQNLRMLHKLASLYSGRPGSVETLKLAKMVLSHLALTGGIAIGDNLLQNVLGRGLAAKVSTRLGEGLANGILTSRVGLAALDLCRPMPFHKLGKPSLKSLIGPLISMKSEESVAA